MWKSLSVINLIFLITLFQAAAQDTIRYSKPKIIDSSDLRWDSPKPQNQTYVSISGKVTTKLKFSKNLSFQIWTYLQPDSALVAEGSWSFNPGGWLVLSTINATSQKYAFRKFANFWFLMRDMDVKRFEKDFLENLGGRQLVKGNGRVLDKNLIDACWDLADRYYIDQE